MKIASLKALGAAGLALYTVGTSLFMRSMVKEIYDNSFDEFSEEFEKNQKVKKASVCVTWAGDILMYTSIAIAKKNRLIDKISIIDVFKIKR